MIILEARMRASGMWTQGLKLLRPWAIVFASSVVYLCVILSLHDWDPMALVMPGTRFSELDPKGTEGYDGQFAYYIALDPSGAEPHLDVPAYRYQRILFPLLCRFLAFGSGKLIPWAMPFVNAIALAAGTYFVEKVLKKFGASPWYALIYGLFPGLLLSVRLDLNEPLAYALVCGSLLAFEKGKTRTGAILLGLAGLTKEQTLLFAGGYTLAFIARRELRGLKELMLFSILPEALLQGALWLRFGYPGIGSGGAGATPFSPIPFGGLLAIGLIKPRALLLWLTILGPGAVFPSIALGCLSITRIVKGEYHPFTFSVLLHALAMAFLPFSTWREFLAVLRVLIGFALATIAYGAYARSRRILNYLPFWLAYLVFLRE